MTYVTSIFLSHNEKISSTRGFLLNDLRFKARGRGEKVGNEWETF